VMGLHWSLAQLVLEPTALRSEEMDLWFLGGMAQASIAPVGTMVLATYACMMCPLGQRYRHHDAPLA
jgi:hypothetical protein